MKLWVHERMYSQWTIHLTDIVTTLVYQVCIFKVFDTKQAKLDGKSGFASKSFK